MSATIRDIANVLNISHTTVSRVLNGRGNEFISEKTRARVLAAAAEMKYRPNRAARALATGRTGMIALWVYDVYPPYYVSVMHHAEQQISQNERDLLIKRMVRYGEADTSLAHLSVDGILALDCVEHIQAQKVAGFPCPPIVSMGVYYLPTIDHVGVNLYEGTREAIKHLVSRGCKRIAYLVPNQGNRNGDARFDAYHRTVGEAGLKPELIVPEVNERPAARATIREYVREHGCPDGLFCLSDDLAIGAYRGLLDRGVRVPEDIALVGCDGIEDTEYLECPISTIVQPHAEMCALAWQFLQKRIEELDAPLQKAILTPQLTIRESSLR